ncbi:unnamed protein product [Rhizophagus irregularis]|nr:unnamed protein product [Rhizophagus irregularis]
MYIRTRNDPSYRLKLIYRGSRNGISNESFRKKCKGRVASLVLIKVKDSNKVFGGYSSIGVCSLGNDFDDDLIRHGFQFYNSSDNFIFSFEDSEDTQNMKISRVVSNSHAILDHSGFNFGRSSLCMINQSLYLTNYIGNYESNLDTNKIYTIEEIETYFVYQ